MSDLSDPNDFATRQSDHFLEVALSKRVAPDPCIGFCYNCQESIPEGKFCDTDCRDDYQLRTRK